VSDYWAGFEDFFEPGREILVVSSADDVQEALSLDREELRQIGAAARKRVLAEHTADRRGMELLSLLEVTA
jgi:spore maturation protein CgeB